MSLTSDRSALRELMGQFAQYWLTGEPQAIHVKMADDMELISHQHGHWQNRDDALHALKRDTANSPLYGQHSNHYIAVEQDQAISSMYLFAMAQHNPQYFLFGSALVMHFRREATGWVIEKIRLQVNWSHGNPELMAHWKNIPNEHGWDLAKEPPVLVSELHSPWVLLPNAPVPENLDQALAELYARYSFAVDQNDIRLLATTYTQDIEGGFAPAGNFKGHDQVISLLKNFRHLAAVWQHFAHIVRIDDEGDGRHAKMIVARIIPERPVSETGDPIYGAHYQLRVRKGDDGQWRVCWTDYRTGWFGPHNVPEFDIGRATA